MTVSDDVDTVSGYVENIETLASASNDLGKAMQLIGEFSKLAKFASGLGVLGAGLGLLSTILGGESDTDRILNAISKLSHQVEELGNRMDAHFERLENVVKQAAARAQLLPAIARLSALRQQMFLLRQQGDQDGPTAKNIRATLRSFSEASILEAAETIRLTMADKQFANNILEATYSTTYGSITTLNDIASGLMSYLVLAATGYGLVRSLGDSDDEMRGHNEAWMTALGDHVKSTFSGKLTEAQTAWDAIINRCVDQIATNVDTKTKRLIDDASNRSDHNQTAIYLRDKLLDHFFWVDWIAIVYDPITGSDVHTMYGWNYKCFFRYRDLNVVVKWVDKNVPARGANRPHGSMANGVRRFPPITKPEQLPAESAPFFSGDQSAENLAKNLLTPLRSPGFVWRCVRYKGVYGAWNNSARVLWKVAESTLCIFE